MKNAIVEKAREFGVPVVLINPSHTSTVCPVHGTKIVYQPDGGGAQGLGVCDRGRELWHRDVVAHYNLRKRAGDVSPVMLGSKESHDPLKRWLRAKSLHSIMNEYKMSEMKV
jgi:putative transposase